MTAGRSNIGLRKRHALQLFKTDMCKFFLQNRCENGDKCSYAHNIDEVRRKPDLTRTSMCKAMTQRGVCTDMGCRFAHSESELRATHGFFKMKMCGFAQSGRCKHGKSCRFAHSPEELRPMKPPAPGVDENVLLDRQPQVPTTLQKGDGHQEQGSQELQMKSFIFGAVPQEHVEGTLSRNPHPPPPEPHAATRGEHRLPRWRSAATGNPQTTGARPGPRNSKTAGGQNVGACEVETTGGALSSTWNESDSADNSSWASGSSATEVPRSEHTGSPQQTTSDSSSGAGAGSGGTLNAASGSNSANASGSTRGDSRTKTKERRRDPGAPNDVVTTLIITNIPTYLTQGALLSMFEDLNYEMRGNFDFYFCPWDESLGHNLGHALLNFVDPNDAAKFQQTWSNKELCRGGRGQKPLRVMKAPVQGLQANIDYFSRVEITPCSDQRFRPLYRDAHGVLQPLQLKEPALPPPEAPSAPGSGDFTSGVLMEPPPTILAAAPQTATSRRRGYRPPDTRRQEPQPWVQSTGAAPRPGGIESPKPDAWGESPAHGQSHLAHRCASQSFQDYWEGAPTGCGETADSTGASQQVLTWPVMMTAMPWPMGEQAQKSAPMHGKGFTNVQDGLVVPGRDGGRFLNAGSECTGGMAGGNQVQVSYQQLLPYMMMPMEAMVPVDGGPMDPSPMGRMAPANLPMLQALSMAGPWPGADEVYTD